MVICGNWCGGCTSASGTTMEAVSLKMSRKREELGSTGQDGVLKTGGTEGPGALGEYKVKQETCSSGSHPP